MIATSPATPARDRIYTTGQLAKICGVAPRTVSKWIDAGHMRGYKIPGSNDRRVPHAALLHFLRQNGMSTHGLESAVASVLYIGSDGAFCDALASALGLDLYDVRRAAGGFEAGVVCREFHPRVAVLDCAIGTAEATAIAGHLRTRLPRVFLAALLHFLRQNGMSTHRVESAVPSVLYIGSDGAFCDSLASALGLDLYDVRRAAGGFDAGVVCREFHPRAAVLDCAIGTAEATAIAGHLRTRLPRVFLAAVANEDACRTVPGFDETFVRPADPAAVASRVVAALGGG